MSSRAKAGPRPTGLSLRENMENRYYEGKQMTVMNLSLTGASSASEPTWDTINWSHVSKEVKRLQMRIAKAVREGAHGKVKALQWLLTHSLNAKLLSVRRVTQNRGAKTPGVDGVLWNTPKQKIQAVKTLQRRGYKTQPLRRIYIPKSRGGKRPLSIPTMACRAMQALHLLALEPIAEMRADKHAYGFRPKRSTRDAIEQCFIVLSRKDSASWILEGDIRACFDSLSGQWLKDNIPMDKTLLTKWLTAGYIEERTLHPTFDGVPQGGIISPVLLVYALSGMEEAIKRATSYKDKINVVVYADDFVITGRSKDVLESKVMPVVEAFLKERGLELSPEKTKITHIDEGFDFLGFNIRKYKGKLLIKPSKKSVKAFLDEIRAAIKSKRAAKQEFLLFLLNPKVRGWANYFCHVVSKGTFAYVDHCIFQMLLKWIGRRHPEKGAEWLRKKYFRPIGARQEVFSIALKDERGQSRFLDLFRAAQVPICRHIKIRAEATPYDPQYKEYFLKREFLRREPNYKDLKGSPQALDSRDIYQTAGSLTGLRKA